MLTKRVCIYTLTSIVLGLWYSIIHANFIMFIYTSIEQKNKTQIVIMWSNFK
jgi:hypothetical protein